MIGVARPLTASRRTAEGGLVRPEMDRTLVTAALAGVLAGAATAFVHRGDWWLSYSISRRLVLYAGMPALVLAGCLEIVRRWSSGPLVTRGLPLLTAAAVAAFSHTVISVPLGLALGTWDIRRAQAFCERLIPRIEAAYHARGAYPPKLDGLLPSHRPRLLSQPDWFYESSPDGFALKVPDHRKPHADYMWDSAWREWRHRE